MRKKIFLLILSSLIGLQIQAVTVNYNSHNGIASNSVRSVFVDHLHRVWLGTDNGISVITSNGIKNYIYSNGLQHNRFWAIAESPNHYLWFGSFGGGLYCFKNDKFLPVTFKLDNKTHQFIRRLYVYKDLLFVGTNRGLKVIDYRTLKEIPFKNHSMITQFQVMGYIEFKDELYFYTVEGHNFFKVNLKDHSFGDARMKGLPANANFFGFAMGDTLVIHNFQLEGKDTIIALKYKFENYLKEYIPNEPIYGNSLLWNVTKFNGHYYGAGWAINEEFGGLYLLKGNKFLDINQQYDISSRSSFDITSDSINQKIYLTSLDNGLYSVDMNQLLSNSNLIKNQIIGLNQINNELVGLTPDYVFRISNGKIKKLYKEKIITEIKKFATDFPFLATVTVQNLIFKKLRVYKDQISVDTRFGTLILDNDLKIKQSIFCFNGNLSQSVSDNKIIIFNDYYVTQIYDRKDLKHPRSFSLSQYNDPHDCFTSGRVFKNLYLVSSNFGAIYLIDVNKSGAIRLNGLDKLRRPFQIAYKSEGEIYILDQSNVLYLMKYIDKSFKLFKIVDLKSYKVVENYSLNYTKGLLHMTTNKGIFMLKENILYFIGDALGLSSNRTYASSTAIKDTLWVGSSDGMMKIDLNKIFNSKFIRQPDKIDLVLNNKPLNIKVGEEIQLNSLNNQLNVKFEFNSHPYLANLVFQYSVDNGIHWVTPYRYGQIQIENFTYGKSDLLLKVKDLMNSQVKVYKLISVNVIQPVYAKTWVVILITLIFAFFIFWSIYQTRTRILKRRTLLMARDNTNLKLQIETLQLLLKPHFIFNALTSIQNLILKREIEKSIDYSNHFSKYLRGILDNSNEKLVSLDEEIKSFKSYVALEQLRLHKDLKLDIQIDETIDTHITKIIPFIMQPLVENIFKHAFKPDNLNPEIKFSVSKSNLGILYSLSDNGLGMNGKTLNDLIQSPHSKGVKIVYAQLEKFFTNQFELNVLSAPTKGTVWTILIKDEL